MKVLEFNTEYCKSPINIDVPPVFCWVNDEEQLAYRLQITDTECKVVYDSGEINTGETIGHYYKGEKLKSDSHYDIKLTVKGKSENCEYLDYFETGLLNEEDWQGVWLDMPSNFTGGALLVRRNLYDLPHKKIIKAKCFIAGPGEYEIYINDRKISENLSDPVLSDYSKRVYYSTYDAVPYLKENNNVLGIVACGGRYDVRCFILQFNFTFSDGSTYSVYSGDHDWWTRGSAVVNASLYGGEVYDARKEVASWADSKTDVSWENGWMYMLRAVQPPAGKKVSQRIESMKVCAEYTPVSENTLENNVFVYDFGQNMSGVCSIKVCGNRGAKIAVYYAEDVKNDGRINRLNLRLADNCDKYILKGNGVEEFTPRFTSHGFRYVEVHIKGIAHIEGIKSFHIRTAVKKTGKFICSDENINKLHKMAVMTESSNLQGIMLDCPQRDERFMWLNDLSSRIYQSINNFNLARVLPKVFDDISDTQDNKGAIADTAPFLTAQRPADPVCICYLLFSLKQYEWYGDIRPIRNNYDKLKAWVDYLVAESEDYCPVFSYYGDWVAPFGEEKTCSNKFISSAYMYWHLLLMTKIAHIADNDKDEIFYKDLADKARCSFNNKFFNKKTKNYENGSQSSNAIALSLGIADENDYDSIINNICDNINANDNHMTCGNQGYRHLLYALASMDKNEYVYKIITNPVYPGWGYMLKSGATTVWERWEKEMTCEMHSFNHPMFSAYDGWFYEFLAGIRIDENSFGANKVYITPIVIDEISYVKCSIETVRGTIVSEWTKNNNTTEYYIYIPFGVSAKIKISGLNTLDVCCGEYRFVTKGEFNDEKKN